MMPYPYFNNYMSYPQPQYQPPQAPAYQTGIVWVADINEASAYPMAPNMVLPLWDKNKQIVYWKQSDAAGRQTIRVLDYTERTGEAQAAEQPATKTDLAAVLAAVHGLEALLKGETNHDE